MDPLKRAVIARLKFHDKQFEELLAILAQGALEGDERIEAQQRLKRLIGDLRDEANDLENRLDGLNRFERRYLEPALRKAGAKIVSHPNTNPDHKWRQDLAAARIDIAWTLHDLESS